MRARLSNLFRNDVLEHKDKVGIDELAPLQDPQVFEKEPRTCAMDAIAPAALCSGEILTGTAADDKVRTNGCAVRRADAPDVTQRLRV